VFVLVLVGCSSAPGGPSRVTQSGSALLKNVLASPTSHAAASRHGGSKPGAPRSHAIGPSSGPTTSGGGATSSGVTGTVGNAPAPPVLTASQGVTATTIKIGVVTTNTAGLQSVKGLNLGDNQAEAQAAINWVNGNGGVDGRRIVPFYLVFNATSDNWENDYQSLCTSATEDHHVFAVISATIAYSKTFAACLAAHNTPLVNSAGGVQDRVLLNELGDYSYTPGSFVLDRLVPPYLQGLHSSGFFAPGSKLGLIRVDDDPFTRVTDNILRPMLSAWGLSLAAEADVNAQQSLGTTSSQMPNIVLRFQQAGVNRVLFLDNGTLAISFVLAASSQGYTPRLGLNSMTNPILMQQNAPSSSLTGSIGVGWQPSGDVDAQHDPADNTAVKICTAVNAQAGQGNVSRTGVWVQRMYCDGVFFLQAALSGSQHITPAGIAAGTAAMGSSFQSAITFSTAFPQGRRDGAAAVRTFDFQQACSCFAYVGPLRSAP
jgi:ABC-type branched-subunit amino acid transport system substrate-binding protein